MVVIGCSNPKDIIMFQEQEDTVGRYELPPKNPEHKIRTFDNLYISVLTTDPEVNALFNPSSKGDGYTSGTEQMYGSPTSRYINGYTVSEKGTINLPMLGELKVTGLSLEEAQNKLKDLAIEYLKEPMVQVKYLNYQVNVLGEVQNPGIYYNYEGGITIFDAISMANGITEFADIQYALVKRHDNKGVRTHNINLNDNSIYNSEVYYLQPNDIVYIPPNRLKRRQENVQTYSQVLSTISTLLVAVALFMNL